MSNKKVGCVPPACQPYIPLRWPPDVSTSGGGGWGGPQVNNFEDMEAGASSGRGLMSDIWGEGGGKSWGRGCTVKSNTSWVMITWGPPVNRQTDTSKNFTFPQLRWLVVMGMSK